MKHSGKNRIASRWISFAATLALLITPVLCAAEEAPADTTENTLAVEQVSKRAPFMAETLGKLTYQKGEDVVVLLPEGATATGELTFETGLHGDERNALISNEAAGDLSWAFSLQTSGWYTLRFDYVLLGDSGNNGLRGLKIDGVSPYFETESVSFSRLFEDVGEVRTNNVGDQVRPSVGEVKQWQSLPLFDSNGYYSTPLIFALEAGEHTLDLVRISQDMAIACVTIEPYVPNISYKDAAAKYPDCEKVEQVITLQAENQIGLKNDSTIRLEGSGDPSTYPSNPGYRVFNAVGGNPWRKGNQTIEFSFTVPKTGLYKIALRVMQNWNDGLPSYRRIMINGETPFAELQEVRFDYDTNWQTVVLGNGEEDFYFYFEEGKTHTLSMAVTMGAVREVVQTMYDDMTLLSEMMLEISKLTGGDPDPNYDYQFFKFIPTLEGDFQTLVNDLKKQYDTINKISGDKSTSMGSSVVSILRQMENMLSDPFTIAKRYNQLEQAQTNLGQWYLDMQKMPLLIDEFTLAGQDQVVPTRKATFWQKLVSTWKNFTISFVKDYNSIGDVRGEDLVIKDSITVWISRGTEWAEVIQEMADEGYTPNSGVAINMNVIPAGQLSTGSANMLMLSVTSGTSPDVVLGIAAASPVEFAIRDAAVDLTKFSDYEEVASRFLPQVFTPLTYKGGVYALPETMLFQALFYRKDVLSKYNITIPDTREELYNVTLPQLFENGLSYYQASDFSQFLYQHGGSFYTEDGYRSALDSLEAYQAFRELTELYTHYSMPVSANFFNRFRTGEMPIGVANFSTYIQLSTAAPELIGKWEMAPIPGVKTEDGTNRTTAGNVSEVDMLIAQESDAKYQYCWDFLKWWTGKEAQLSFAREIEALVGVEARWNTANVEAFLELDWSNNDVKVIQEQWKWIRETPIVLGSAYTGRHITNAFTNVVVSGLMTPRDALEKAIKEINRELRTKQEEYGVFVTDEKEGN